MPSLLGRLVKLIYYDEQSNPWSVPGIYIKLLDLDRGDLIIGGYGTTQIAPAMLVVIQRNKVFVTLFGLAVNTEFKYPNYFSMISDRPGRHQRILRHCDGAESTATVAIIAGIRNTLAVPPRRPARMPKRQVSRSSTTEAIRLRLRITRRSSAQSLPQIQTSSSSCSYPLNSVGMVKAVNEIGFKPKMIGGGMVGLQSTAAKTQLGALLNGFVNYDFWLPVPKLLSPAVSDLINTTTKILIRESDQRLESR